MSKHTSIKRIRVLHLITDLDVHGAETVLSNLVKGSDANGFCHEVVSMTNVGPIGQHLILAGFKVSALRMRRGVPSPVALFRLGKIISRYKPQVLHCWMYHANLLGLFVGKLTGVPHILWGIRSANVELSNYGRLTRWVIWLGARFSRLPAAITLNSEAGRRLHQMWGYDMARIALIPNGFDIELFKPDPAARLSVRAELGIAENTVLIGLIARFHPVKGHAMFFKAAGLLSRSAPGVHFILSGDEVSPNNSTLVRMIRENQLDGKVHLLGSRLDIARVMAALDVACLTSESEAFPNVVAEAMACGVPCVATDVGDSASIICGTGRVVPPQDPGALAEAISEFIAMDASVREQLGRNGRNRVATAFALTSMVRSYELLYESMAARVEHQTAYSVAN
jgi:glycosyltransferase involved in cell wall biosynthesis